MAKYKKYDEDEYTYSYEDGADDFSDNFRENQNRWKTEPEKAHSAQEKNVAALDKETGGKSKYASDTGVWSLSDGRKSTADGVMGNSYLSPYFNRSETEGYKIRENARKKYRDNSFSYDPSNDELYEQYKRQYIENGQRASDDAIARSAARTGGMASSYAATAGALAYQDYMTALNDKIPELSQLAYQKWEDEQERNLEEASYGEDMMNEEYSDWAMGREEYLGKKDERESDALSYAVAMNKAQTEGYGALSESEKETIYKQGSYYIPETDEIADISGTRYKLGIRAYSEDEDNTAQNKIAAILFKAQNSKNGAASLSVSEMTELLDAGYTIDSLGIRKSGTSGGKGTSGNSVSEKVREQSEAGAGTGTSGSVAPNEITNDVTGLDGGIINNMKQEWLEASGANEDKRQAVEEYLTALGMDDEKKRKYIEEFIRQNSQDMRRYA